MTQEIISSCVCCVLPHQYIKIFSHETQRIGDHLWHLMVALFYRKKKKNK